MVVIITCVQSLCQFAIIFWFVVLGLIDPLRQHFSLYRVVSQREGERKEKR